MMFGHRFCVAKSHQLSRYAHAKCVEAVIVKVAGDPTDGRHAATVRTARYHINIHYLLSPVAPNNPKPTFQGQVIL